MMKPKRVLITLTAAACEASGSQHHPSICHRAEVGQNYLDFSCRWEFLSAGCRLQAGEMEDREHPQRLHDYSVATGED